ncbi:MAG: ATP-binding domain-containing protein [Synechococcaceae cyanobacterium SM2_3_1]|nr:ATP-binding domain-containing protein [Synechococcaceae cyanobacterium SM2_3_1]
MSQLGWIRASVCVRQASGPISFARSLARARSAARSQSYGGLLDGNWFGNAIEPLQPHEIAIFYPYGGRRLKPLLEELEESIGELCPVVWVNKNRESRKLVTDQAMKIQTIHSAKGLQYKAVVMLWADLLPKDLGNSTEEEDRKLFYVALTRPEDYLAITASGSSKFVSEISNSGKVVIA